MKLFVAIWLPSEVVDALPLPLLQEHLTRQGVRFSRKDKVHLTLRYLGNVDPARHEALVASLTDATVELDAVELTASGLGAFPHLDRPKVIWAGIQGDLLAIHERIVEATDDFAEVEVESFTPHLTLARISPPSQKVGRALLPLVKQMEGVEFGRWRAGDVGLVETLPDGHYRSDVVFPLRNLPA